MKANTPGANGLGLKAQVFVVQKRFAASGGIGEGYPVKST